jgi:hypothetical protein
VITAGNTSANLLSQSGGGYWVENITISVSPNATVTGGGIVTVQIQDVNSADFLAEYELWIPGNFVDSNAAKSLIIPIPLQFWGQHSRGAGTVVMSISTALSTGRIIGVLNGSLLVA